MVTLRHVDISKFRLKHKQKNARFYFGFLFWIPACAGMTILYLLFPQPAFANEAIKAVTFSSNFSYQSTFVFDNDSEKILGNSWSAALIDNTIFLSASEGNGGVVAWNLASGETKIWFPYGESLRGGIALTRCVRNGREEIATAPVEGNAHVLRFNPEGKQLSPGFFLRISKYRNVSKHQLACADHDGDDIEEIVIGERSGNDLTIFITETATGKVLKSFQISNWGPFDFNLGSIDLGGDEIDEILVGAGGMMRPEVRIYRGDGALVNRFEVFPKGFIGGVFVAGTDIDGDKKEELVVSAGPGGGHLRALDGFGVEKATNKFFPFGEDFRGGVIPLTLNAKSVGDAYMRPARGVADLRPLLVMAASFPVDDTTKPKSILIDISTQRLGVLSYGFESAKFPISTGTWNYPTPKGAHAITNKIKRAYSRRYGLYMPWWMAIVPSGTYGIHELPEWPNGTKEGEGHLGQRRSHGCIRLGVGPAKALYDWGKVGVPVTVR